MTTHVDWPMIGQLDIQAHTARTSMITDGIEEGGLVRRRRFGKSTKEPKNQRNQRCRRVLRGTGLAALA